MPTIDEHQIATSKAFCSDCGALTEGRFCSQCGHCNGLEIPATETSRIGRRFESRYPPLRSPSPRRTGSSRSGAAAIGAVLAIAAIVAAAVVLVATNGLLSPAPKAAAVTPAVTPPATPATVAAPKGQHKTNVRTVTRTVTAPSTTIVHSQVPAAAAPASPGLSPACGNPDISINSATSCGFAASVFARYATDARQGGFSSYRVSATSSATGRSYTDNCQLNRTTQIVDCSHGSDMIQFPERAAAVYNPAGQ